MYEWAVRRERVSVMLADPGAIEAQRAQPGGERAFRAALRAPWDEDPAREVRRLRELLLRRSDELERERHVQRAAEDARTASLRNEVKSLRRELSEERAARADEARRLKAAVLEARAAIGTVLRDRDTARAGEVRAVAEAASMRAERDDAVRSVRAEVEAEVCASGEAMAAVVQALEREQAALRAFAEKCVSETSEVREEMERLARAASAKEAGRSVQKLLAVPAAARKRRIAQPRPAAPSTRVGNEPIAFSAPECGPEPRSVPIAIAKPFCRIPLSPAAPVSRGVDRATSPLRVEADIARGGEAASARVDGATQELLRTPPRTPLRTIPRDLESIIDKFYDSDVRQRQLKSAEKLRPGESSAYRITSPRRLELDDVEDEQKAMARSISRSSPAPKAKFPGELFGRAAVLAEAARQEVRTEGKVSGSMTTMVNSPSLDGVSPTLAALLKGNPQSAGGWLRYLQGGESPEDDRNAEPKQENPSRLTDSRKSKLGAGNGRRRNLDLSPTLTPSPTPRKQKPTPTGRGSHAKKPSPSKKVSPAGKRLQLLVPGPAKEPSSAIRSPLLDRNSASNCTNEV